MYVPEWELVNIAKHSITRIELGDRMHELCRSYVASDGFPAVCLSISRPRNKMGICTWRRRTYDNLCLKIRFEYHLVMVQKSARRLQDAECAYKFSEIVTSDVK